MTASSDVERSRRFLELLCHALLDAEFREKLYGDRASVAKEYDLSAEHSRVLTELDWVTLEKAADRITDSSEFAIGPARRRGHNPRAPGEHAREP